MPNPDTTLGRGCGRPSSVLACVAATIVVAVFVAGYLWITGASFFEPWSAVK